MALQAYVVPVASAGRGTVHHIALSEPMNKLTPFESLRKELKEAGLRVYMPKRSDTDPQHYTYAYVTDGTNIAYIEEYSRGSFMGSLSTVHVPAKYIGTGFGIIGDPRSGREEDAFTVEAVKKAMNTVVPHWFPQYRGKVTKWNSWDEFEAKHWNSLTEV